MSAGEQAREWALVGLAFVLLAGVAAVWVALDARPPEWDHANHLERAVKCARDLDAGAVQAILERSSFYPPLVPCAAGLLYRRLPSDVAAGQAVIVLFLGIGMAAVYRLGRRVWSGPAGVAAAVMFGTAPFVVFSTLRFQLDLPLAAMVAVTLTALHASEGFDRLGWSLAAGVAAGLGMLTKPTFAVYVVPVALWVLVRGSRRASLLKGALATVLAAAISLPWYGPRIFGLPTQLANRSFKNAVLEGKPEAFSAAGLLFYPTWIVPQLGVLTVLLALAGIVIAVRRRLIFPLVAVIVPAIVVVLIPNKDLRYALPLLPAATVLAGLALDPWPRLPRRGLAAALVIAGALQVSATAFGVPRNIALPGLGVRWVLATPPLSEDWRHRQILGVLVRDSGGARATVSVVPNHAFFSVSNFRYYGLRDGLPLHFMRAWDDEPLGVDYMIIKDGGNQGPVWTADKPRRIVERLRADAALARAFPVIAEYPLPDGSRALVRARRLLPGVDTPPATLARATEVAFRARAGEVARDVEQLDVKLTYDGRITQGRIARIDIEAGAATLAEFRRRDAARLRVHDVRLVLEDVVVNPYAAAAGRLEPLDVGRARIERLTVLGGDLQAFLHELKGFRRAGLVLEPGTIRVAMAQPGPDVAARVRIAAAADRPFALEFERVTVGGVPVPRRLVNWVVRHYDPTGKIASRLPFPVDVNPITVAPDAIRIVPATRTAR